MKIGIGIDTGGTYTDTVVYDFENKTVLGTGKALTTRQNLTIGILEALDALPQELLRMASVISLSTTLATNACVEDKGGAAKLIFFGGEAGIIDQNGKAYGLPPSKEILLLESYTQFSGEMEREPDWDAFCANIESGFEDCDGVGIIEMNAMKNGAVLEKKAKALVQQRYDLPVVCAHELSNALNSLQRGASVLLNARLVPVIREFLTAIKTAMTKRAIHAELIIVRSDGSMMSEDFAHTRPVETLLCGPAASVMGSLCLTGEQDCVVVDMGGTTTDIALIENGLPIKTTDGCSVGKWKTFVNGIYIKTLGLGGDTAIHYRDGQLFLEDYRVVPLCVAAAAHPCVVDNLKKLLANATPHTKYLHEHYLLVKDITDSERYTEEERLLCAALREGPMTRKEAAAAIPGKDLYNLPVDRLIKEGVVQVCGLTPTDIMHIKGDFNRFSTEASELAARYVALNVNGDMSVDALCAYVYDDIKRKLYVNIVKALLENKHNRNRKSDYARSDYTKSDYAKSDYAKSDYAKSDYAKSDYAKSDYIKNGYMKNGVSKEVEHFINESYDNAKTGMADKLLTLTCKTNLVLTGIGAPIRYFLHDVAHLLGTKAVIPDHYEVANALGAIVGHVRVICEVEIRPMLSVGGITGFAVYGSRENSQYETLAEAESRACAEAERDARDEALRRGVRGAITVTCTLTHHEAPVKGGAVYIGTRAVAQATGALF